MDFKGQTTVLAAIFVLVGMMFLVPAITGKALATVHATAKPNCETVPESQKINRHGSITTTNNIVVHPNRCTISFDGRKTLNEGRWTSEPTHPYPEHGTDVTWSTAGKPPFGDEKGSVTVIACGETQCAGAELTFYNPVLGTNECSVRGHLGGSCNAGKGQSAEFTYTVTGK